MVYPYSLVSIALTTNLTSLEADRETYTVVQEEDDEEEQDDGPAPLVPARPLRRRVGQLA